MEALARDVRLAVRVLARTPGFTAAAVLCLGLGIGATSAVWSVVQTVLLRALPYEEPERVVTVWERGEEGPERLPVSVPELFDLREQRGVFAEVSLVTATFLNLTGDGEPERLTTGRASANFFSLLGVPTQLGRTFEPQEGTAGNHRVAVLSAGLWRRRFGADRDILGRSLTLGDEPFTVVGVLPDGFRFQRFPDEPDLWTPIVLDPAKSPPRDARTFGCLARLAPGVTLERARAEMTVLARRFRADYPQFYPDKEWRIELNSLQEVMVMDVRTSLLVLFAAVVLLLLIACSNVANLLLARAAARGKEVALRTAIGASRGGLVRQFLAEALVLAACGGALGLALAWWSTRILVALDPEKLPRVKEIGLDGASIAFTAALVLATAVLVGLLPALRASRAPLNDVLKEGGKTSGMGSSRHSLRGALVVVEMALAVVVLVGAGLVARSLARLVGQDPGFRTRGVLTFEVFTTMARYPQDPLRAALAEQLLERLRALPGVERAALINGLPLASTGLLLERVVEDRPPAPGTSPPLADWRIASPGYFEALGIPLVEGRTFTVRDQAGGVEVAVVDESLARSEWPRESALGKRLKLNRPDGKGGLLTIVGVVRPVRAQGLEKDPGEQVYTPWAQTPRAMMSVVLATAGDPLQLASQVRQAVWSVDRDLSVERVRPLDDVVAEAMAGRRSYTLLLAFFAAAALLLVVVGVYGVMAYSVVQRAQEIGIRMALGARRATVLKLIVGQGLALAGLGVLTGTLAAFWASRFIAGTLYGVAATDAATFAAVIALLLALALASAYLPARRATRVDPVVALKAE